MPGGGFMRAGGMRGATTPVQAARAARTKPKIDVQVMPEVPPGMRFATVMPGTPEYPTPIVTDDPRVPMNRPSYAVINTGLRRQEPSFWDRVFAAQQAGYLARRQQR